MKKFENISEMELGNLFFGNSHGLYHVEPRKEYQDVFVEFLYSINCDFYGHNDDGSDFIDNDTFTLRPYYWGEDECIAELPNFVYKPTGLEIKWYKYPMRDAYSNMDVDIEQFKEIIDHCTKEYLNSVNGRL